MSLGKFKLALRDFEAVSICLLFEPQLCAPKR